MLFKRGCPIPNTTSPVPIQMSPINPLSEIKLSQQKLLRFNNNTILFPTVLAPNPNHQPLSLEQFKEILSSKKSWVEDLIHSTGVILFRGFPVSDAAAFNEVVEAFGYEPFPYTGAAVRLKVVGRVMTANEALPEKIIPFHHEMSHIPKGPLRLFFFCEEEPGKDGETPVVLSNRIYQKMLEKHPDFMKKLEEHGLIYKEFLGDEADISSPVGGSWQSVLSAKDKASAEARAKELEMKLEWAEKGVYVTLGPKPAFKLDEARGNMTWFNRIVASYVEHGFDSSKVAFGDGTPLAIDVIKDCYQLLEEECVAIPWKKGDIMLVDNKAALHSRRPFEPPRRILVALGC